MYFTISPVLMILGIISVVVSNYVLMAGFKNAGSDIRFNGLLFILGMILLLGGTGIIIYSLYY